MKTTVTLNNGVEMPRIGYGVYQIPARDTKRCVLEAIRAGYRHIDTAQCYGNERPVGEAIRESGIPRKEIFVTTKLWGCRGFKDAERSIAGSIAELGIGPIDLLLIHEPTGDIREIYRAMEEALRSRLVRAIGVSNFLDDTFRRFICEVDIIPAVNQVETHVFRQQRTLAPILKAAGTVHKAWSPLASGGRILFGNPELQAIASKYGKTVSQIALRFLYQQGIVVIPKSTHFERMKENLSITDFELAPEDMANLRRLDQGKSLFGWW